MEPQPSPPRPFVSECPLPELNPATELAANSSYIVAAPTHAGLTAALLAYIGTAHALCAAAHAGAYAHPSFHEMPGGLRFMLSAHRLGNCGIIAMTEMCHTPDEALAALAKLLHQPYPLVLEIDGATAQQAA